MHLKSYKIFGWSLRDLFRAVLWLMLVGLMATIAYLPISRQEPFDDAFMFLRYAYNLLNYGVFGWNLDQPAYGCTSIAYVFSTAFFVKTGVFSGMKQVSLLLIQSSLYYFLGLFIVDKTQKIILQKQTSYLLEIRLLLLLQLLLAAIFRRNITGMDTTMAFFSNALLIYAAYVYYRNQHLLNLIGFGLAAYFTFLVRPDNGLYALLFPALFMLLCVKNRQDTWRLGLLIAVLFVGDAWAKYLYFGHVLPIPFYVKAQGFYEAYLGIFGRIFTLFGAHDFVYYSSV